MDVVVAGGGLVGLCCAWFLRGGGAAVVVLERDRVGGGASRGNAGEICPGHVEPLPAPGMLGHAVANMFRPDAALHVRPAAVPRLAGFLLGFARHANRGAYERGLAALTQLGRRTFELYDRLEDAGVAVGMGREGYVICARSQAVVREQHEWVGRMASRGIASSPGPLLGPEDLAELEPALAGSGAGGFLQPDERWIDPSAFVDAMASALRERGVEIVEGSRVTGVREDSSGVVVESAKGAFRADAAVVAAGVWSAELTSALGVRLPLRPGKGYSFSVKPRVMPRRVLNFGDAHVIGTPMGERLRIAGTMEFDGTHDRFNRSRIEAIVRGVRPYMPHVDWNERSEEWVGARPMTPDGLPFIGPVPGRSRVYVAAGHNMLGVTLSPATGAVVADLVLRGRAQVDLAPFAPERASGWNVGRRVRGRRSR